MQEESRHINFWRMVVGQQPQEISLDFGTCMPLTLALPLLIGRVIGDGIVLTTKRDHRWLRKMTFPPNTCVALLPLVISTAITMRLCLCAEVSRQKHASIGQVLAGRKKQLPLPTVENIMSMSFHQHLIMSPRIAAFHQLFV